MVYKHSQFSFLCSHPEGQHHVFSRGRDYPVSFAQRQFVFGRASYLRDNITRWWLWCFGSQLGHGRSAVLLSSAKYKTCGQITVSAQQAVPGQMGSAASQKLLDARRVLGGNLKTSLQRQHRSASRAFSQFLLCLDKAAPSSLIPALGRALRLRCPAHSYRCADLAGTLHAVWPWHLGLTSYVSSKVSTTYWKTLTLGFVANLPCGSRVRVDWEGWSHGTQWHALCAPAEQKSHCLTPSYQLRQRKEQSQHIFIFFFCLVSSVFVPHLGGIQVLVGF